jgi:hypothetical protein
MTATVALAGVVDGMPDVEYHAHPALSCSGARKLLPPSCPALFRWEQDHPRESTKAFDAGHAAHQLVLGTGPEIVVIEHDDWRTKDAKERRDAAYAAGQVPLLTKEYEPIKAMAAALRAHPVASKLLDPGRGRPEQSLFWTDRKSGVPLRARLDFLPHVVSGRRLLLADYKTALSADPVEFKRSAANYGYHQQDSWYSDAARALGLDPDPAFLFVVQMKSPPYLVTVVELDEQAKRIGRQLNRHAINTFQQCTAQGRWPGFSDEVELVSLPAWYVRKYEETE